MREDYIILPSSEGGPVSLSGMHFADNTLSVLFESGRPGAGFETSDLIINSCSSGRSFPLIERKKGELQLDIDLRHAPSYEEGFGNYYEVILCLRALTDEAPAPRSDNDAFGRSVINEIPAAAVPDRGSMDIPSYEYQSSKRSSFSKNSQAGRSSFRSSSMVLSERNCGVVSFIYDTDKKEAFSIAFNGSNLSQSQTDDWNRQNKSRESVSSLEELLSGLDCLPGLYDVKKEIRSSINVNRLQRIRKARGFSAIDMSLHMVFTGNPGTGKTTLARMLAKIYKEAGILSKGQFVEADRGSLVSHYIGGTAVKTGKVIDSAIGGILFIDEAYALADGQDGKDYGREAIATLLKKMEDNRDNLIVIVAGYPDKMEKFLDSNPGFRSRFNRFIHFNDYSPEELTDIFLYECRKYSLVPENGIGDILTSYFRKALQEKDPYFANGRTVRNIFEQTLVNQANRFAGRDDISDRELMSIKIEDLPDLVNAAQQKIAKYHRIA